MNRTGLGILLAALLLVAGPASARAGEHRVVIVKSSENTYFDETVETLVSRVNGGATFRVVTTEKLADEIDPADPRLFLVALGQAAVQAIDTLRPRPPSINAYITFEQYQQLGLGDRSSILLDQPLERYLEFSRLLLDIDSIGIIVDDNDTAPAAFDDSPVGSPLLLNSYRSDEHDKLLPVLRRLLQQEDALLMLPRARIYNRDSLKGVLLTSYRMRKPVISYSPAHVKSGALASIYSSPRDIGHHLALMLDRIFSDPDFRPPTHEFARFYSIATNPRVARALGLTLADEITVRAAIDGGAR